MSLAIELEKNMDDFEYHCKKSSLEKELIDTLRKESQKELEPFQKCLKPNRFGRQRCTEQEIQAFMEINRKYNNLLRILDDRQRLELAKQRQELRHCQSQLNSKFKK